MPDGLIKTAHFRRTPQYIQISGTYEPSVMNLGSNDCGGEYDSEGAEGVGNPAGVTINNGRYFSQFIGACDIPGHPVFCLRICPDYSYCDNRYDLMGCLYVMPGDYNEPNAFTNCDGNADLSPGVYNSSYTFHQGNSVTPTAVTAPASSNCKTVSPPTSSGVTYTWNQLTASLSTGSSSKPTSTSGANQNGGKSNAAVQSGGTVQQGIFAISVGLVVSLAGMLLT